MCTCTLKFVPAISATISAELTLVPRRGNILGGTPVLISGQCIDREKVTQYSCEFDGRRVRGFYYNERTVLCVTPIMRNIGRVEFKLRIAVQESPSDSRQILESIAPFQTGIANDRDMKPGLAIKHSSIV